MATRPRRILFLTTRVLAILHSRRRARRFLTEDEIVSLIPEPEFFPEHGFFPMWNPQDWVADVLRDLQALGIVTLGGTNNGLPSDGTRRWALRPEWMTENADGGRDDGPPPPLNNEGGDGPGDGSLREVLGHRYLFALSDQDFDAALDNALGI